MQIFSSFLIWFATQFSHWRPKKPSLQMHWLSILFSVPMGSQDSLPHLPIRPTPPVTEVFFIRIDLERPSTYSNTDCHVYENPLCNDHKYVLQILFYIHMFHQLVGLKFLYLCIFQACRFLQLYSILGHIGCNFHQCILPYIGYILNR